ncbi:unnamed protein product [Meloidogyne enterolobii]|uniref:Uncharacterized protein n=1 Tax=Meloidogyne enterolobii TaxID=390850 RepID=A0ACB0YQW7_MELEN
MSFCAVAIVLIRFFCTYLKGPINTQGRNKEKKKSPKPYKGQKENIYNHQICQINIRHGRKTRPTMRRCRSIVNC